ncbi:2-hydroxychromene-2-carboxylate isomerase [Erythrobacter mangrovi]|uniref:2-hydroxychromene-2-carboxylate isomerase n=1 Tax=Erythrobacter mangrovi TaxID=2739433 RepID=A0A7D4BH25_9SPHN|nr:2-hydroxychromene-2-carboxylate isomerase [Erythrobacter mangrovi]QKG71962.1 2-hydroxychromene-2-carboxylate isomerase [Erythrobacter mangrovi]
MPQAVEFIFDLVSPNAYLSWWPLREMLSRQGAELEITPVFLGGMHKLTGNAPPFARDAEIRGKNAYASLEMRRFIDRHGLTGFRMPAQFPFNTILPQRMLLAVEGEERVALAEGLLKALWEDGVSAGDPDALATVATAAGLDAAAILAATQDDAIKQRLVANTDSAVERGAFGIPTFFVGDEMWFGKERLGQIEEYLAGGKP